MTPTEREAATARLAEAMKDRVLAIARSNPDDVWSWIDVARIAIEQAVVPAIKCAYLDGLDEAGSFERANPKMPNTPDELEAYQATAQEWASKEVDTFPWSAVCAEEPKRAV